MSKYLKQIKYLECSCANRIPNHPQIKAITFKKTNCQTSFITDSKKHFLFLFHLNQIFFFVTRFYRRKWQRRKLKLSFLPFNFHLQFLFSSHSFILLTEERKWKEKLFDFFFQKEKLQGKLCSIWQIGVVILLSSCQQIFLELFSIFFCVKIIFFFQEKYWIAVKLNIPSCHIPQIKSFPFPTSNKI